MSGKAKGENGWSIERDVLSAVEAGMEIIRTTPTTLLIDLDSPRDVSVFPERFNLLKDCFHLEEVERYRSKSGNWHVILKCRELVTRDRLAIQAMLGSDLKREALGILMLEDGIESPSVLFKPKQESK